MMADSGAEREGGARAASPSPRWRVAALATALVLALGVLLTGGTGAEALPGRYAEAECLPDHTVQAVERRPGLMPLVADACQAWVLGQLGEGWSAADAHVVTASLLAHRVAPYGSTDAAVTLDGLLGADHLECFRYAALTMLLLPDHLVERMWALGFQTGPVGNHAQLLYRGDGGTLLLDPTVGAVAEIGYDALLMGEQPAQLWESGVWRDDDHLHGFRGVVLRALDAGGYRPSDLLYVYDDLALYTGQREPGLGDNFLTPGGVTWRQLYGGPGR